MKEKDGQAIFGKSNTIVGFFELKISKTNRLPFSGVRDHQIEALKNAQQNGLYYKIMDSPWGKTGNHRFTTKKPFDCFLTKPMEAYVVIFWFIPRKRKEFHYIPIDTFLGEKANSVEKSITHKRSAEISENVLQV